MPWKRDWTDTRAPARLPLRVRPTAAAARSPRGSSRSRPASSAGCGRDSACADASRSPRRCRRSRHARGFIPSLPTLDPRCSRRRSSRRAAALPARSLDARRTPRSSTWRARRLPRPARARPRRRGDVVLMPAYHHGVEVEAVRAAGARIVFYRVDRAHAHRPRRRRARMLATAARARALRHPLRRLRPADRRGAARCAASAACCLFEDCALALFSRDADGRPLGRIGDPGCLLPLQDAAGAARRAAPRRARRCPAAPRRRSPRRCTTSPARCWRTSSCIVGALGRACARRARSALARHRRQGGRRRCRPAPAPRPARARRSAPRRCVARCCRASTARIVVRAAAATSRACRRARRRRARRPAARCRPAPARCSCPFDRATTSARALQALRARGIDAIDFWSSGDPACDAARFPEVAALRRHDLELPIHQSLDDEAIDRVAHAVKQVLRAWLTPPAAPADAAAIGRSRCCRARARDLAGAGRAPGMALVDEQPPGRGVPLVGVVAALVEVTSAPAGTPVLLVARGGGRRRRHAARLRASPRRSAAAACACSATASSAPTTSGAIAAPPTRRAWPTPSPRHLVERRARRCASTARCATIRSSPRSSARPRRAARRVDGGRALPCPCTDRARRRRLRALPRRAARGTGPSAPPPSLAREAPGFRIECAHRPDEVARGLDALFELHHKRWAVEGGSDGIDGPRRRGLPPPRRARAGRAAAGRASTSSTPRARRAPRSTASRHGDRFAFYQAGSTRRGASARVGTVLLGAAIEDAFRRGLAEFDLLRGDEAYKSTFASSPDNPRC